MNNALCAVREAGFTLLPVVLAMSLIAAIAFLLNRDNGVNANLIGAQSDRKRARYAAEAGLQAANYAIQAKGCAGGYPISGSPVADTDFGGATYSAYADTSSGFSVVLRSTGTYNGASVTLSRSNVTAFWSAMQTTTLQGPATSQDTYLDATSPAVNHGAATALQLWTLKYEPLLKFVFSSLPTGSRVIPWYDGTTLQPGANLSLYQAASSSSSGSVSAYLITRSWTANGATWNTYDGVNAWPSLGGYNATPLATNTHAAANGWYYWDITDAVVAWMSGVYPNNGVWMRSSSGIVNNTQYVSGEDTTNPTTFRPKITVNYLAPCAAVPITLPPLAPTADAYIDGSQSAKNFGSSNSLVVYYNTSIQQNRSLLQFDTSGIPLGSVIQAAKLRLNSTGMGSPSSNPKTWSAYALTESWVGGTGDGVSPADGVTYNTRNGVTAWTTAGGTYRTQSIAIATEESSGISPLPSVFRTGWVYWELKTLVQEWVDGITPNNGVILISDVQDTPTIASRENSTAANRPQFVITYRPPGP